MNNLIIFDTKGNPIPSIENNGVFSSVVNIPKHSSNLPESISIYVMEKISDISGTKLTRPICDIGVRVEIDGDGYELFRISNDSFIEKTKEVILNTTYNEDGSVSYANSPMPINFMHSGSIEDVYEGKMRIFLDNHLVWEISLYTEVEEEDERFSELLSNVNEDLSNRHEVIFRGSDINEDLPSAMILNDKRKELLTTINDILPYMSSTRGIKDMIDFFDYTGIVEVKEYWYDEKKDTIKIVPIDGIYKDTSLQKLSRFGLFYKINDLTGKFDENGLPLLEDTFTFSHNEVLIKLFSLKEYFVNRSVGGISEIVDIIGEVYNFQLLSIKHWRTTSDVLVYDKSPSAQYEIKGSRHYIDILKPKIENVLESYVNIDEIGNVTIDELKYHNFSHFKGYLNGDIRFNDDGSIKIGAEVDISNVTFKNEFGDINYSWDAVSYIDITWENSPHPSFYGISYQVSRSIECVAKDGRTFSKTITGSVSDMTKIKAILPYDGFYDLSMTIHGYDGLTTSVFTRKAFEVMKKEIDFMFFFKILDENLQKFSTNEVTWEDINQEFDQDINFNNNLHSSNDTVTPRYADVEYMNIGGGVLKQRYKDSSFMWQDYALMSFSDTNFSPTKLQKFVISGIIGGSSIQIGEDELVIPDININEYDHFAKILTMNLTEDFEYTYRKRYNHDLIDCLSTRYSQDASVFVGSSEDNIFGSNTMSAWEDFNYMFWECDISFRNSKRIIKLELETNSFSVSNLKSFYGYVDVPRVVPLFMSIENNVIYGKKDAIWKVYDNKGKIVSTGLGTEHAHMFGDCGDYSVELEIEDINGNKYMTRRNNSIKVVDPMEYLKNYKNGIR